MRRIGIDARYDVNFGFSCAKASDGLRHPSLAAFRAARLSSENTSSGTHALTRPNDPGANDDDTGEKNRNAYDQFKIKSARARAPAPASDEKIETTDAAPSEVEKEWTLAGEGTVLHQCSFRRPSPPPNDVDKVKSALSILSLRVDDQRDCAADCTADHGDSFNFPLISIYAADACPFPLNRDFSGASGQTEKVEKENDSHAQATLTAIKIPEMECRHVAALTGMRESTSKWC